MLRLHLEFWAGCLTGGGLLVLYLVIRDDKSTPSQTNDAPMVNLSLSDSHPPRHPKLHSGLAVKLTYDALKRIWLGDGRPILWAFWDNPERMPAYIQLGLASLVCHNPKARLLVLSESVLPDWIDHIHPSLPFLLGAHKGDYVRGRLLDEYGGVWVDADSIAFAPFQSLFDKLPKLTTNLVSQMGVVLDHHYPFLVDHYRDPTQHNYTLRFGELLGDIVETLIQRFVKDEKSIPYFLVNGERTMGQLTASIHWDPLANLSEPRPAFHFAETEILMFHNNPLHGEEQKWDLIQMAGSDVMLAEVFRLSFDKCRGHMLHGKPYSTGPEQRVYSIESPPKLMNDDLIHWMVDQIPLLLANSL